MAELRACGVDLGASEVKFALCDAGGVVLHKARSPSRGHPLAALLDLIAGLPTHLRDSPVRIAITGSGRYLLDGIRDCTSVNEVLATALAVQRALPGARTVIDLRGQFSKWILLGNGAGETVIDFSSNGLCAAGAGAFLEQQASRLHLTVDRLGRMAAGRKKQGCGSGGGNQ